ncbi:hypothetical protein K501DRAFT_202772 [Backusella circina FSU 941]|nr:hypothetical protein K501DRAFT_202772 [Backusella circina FSU 941]
MPGTFRLEPAKLIPDWYSQNAALRPKVDKVCDALDELLPPFLYGEWYHNLAALFLTAFFSYILSYIGGGLGSVLVLCFAIAMYYRTSIRKYRMDARDDIQRELSKFKMEDDEESVEWMNNFMLKFWLTFEPVLSALIVENVDNYVPDYLPSFLESVRLSTFTLGTKPFRIESVKTYSNTDPDVVCMDWRVSFIPSDTTDSTEKELDYKVNPKIVIKIRAGKGNAGVTIPVVVENPTFSGHVRVRIKFVGRFPFAKLVEASFLEKPVFDYTLKPLGSDSLGFDINLIPGLQAFIRDQVHTILGPLMYMPNVLTLDMEKIMAGDLDLSSANGVLGVTVYSASPIKNIDTLLIDETPNCYIRFFLDEGQELDRTSVCENTFTPKWNETRYLMLNNLNSLLSMELKTIRPGYKERRLATANYDLSTFDDDTNSKQEGLDVMLLHNGKQVSDLRVDLRYIPVSKAVKRPDGTIEPPIESNTGILRLMINECHKLPSSQISPYIRVIVNGVEKKKTKVVNESAEPKYDESCETVILDKSDTFVRIEVKDGGKNANDKLLGTFTSYLNDISKLQSENEGWWDIMNGDEKYGQIRFNAEWKPMVMAGMNSLVNANGFDKPPIGVIRFTFWGAKNLRNVENITGGKSDPYVRVLSGHQIRGRTEVIDNDLSPEWGETMYIPVHSLKENFVLEVMDWNEKSKDKSLGIVEFKSADLIVQRVGDQSVNPDLWFEPSQPKLDRNVRLLSNDKQTSKGELHYSAEFLPILASPKKREKPDTKAEGSDDIPSLKSLVGTYIKYTPDNLVDLYSYPAGVLRLKIHEVQLSHLTYAYCQVIVDAVNPLYKTAKLRGQSLKFGEQVTAFIKETDFSRVAIEIKPAHADEKDPYKLGHLIDSGTSILRRIMKRKRMTGSTFENDEGVWLKLMGTDGPGRIRLSADYEPLDNYVLNPDESLDNQGVLTCRLLSGKDLKAADKSGTSDPYVIFNVNGEKVYKSDVVKKTLNPKWTNEKFTVNIQSRVTASIRIEVFDWNQVQGDDPIGSGGITLRGDSVESFMARRVDIPLDGVAGVSGSVQVEFIWHPQLLSSKKTQTSVLTSSRTYAHNNLTAAEAITPLPRSSTISSTASSQRLRTLSTETSSSDPAAVHEISGSQSLESVSRYSVDDTVSIAPSQLEEMGNVTNATGRDGKVEFTFIEARGLRGVDKSGYSDPYVRVKVGKSQVFKSKYIAKTLTPEWNEGFTYKVGNDPLVFDIKVKDYNKIQAAVDLGQTRFNIWDLIKLDAPNGETTELWLPLYPSGSGEILLKARYSSA